MRRTIHLCQRSLPAPLTCLACVNRSDWDTIYRDHRDYRRCIDDPDERDRPKLIRFSTPTRSGYYWAEWRPE